MIQHRLRHPLTVRALDLEDEEAGPAVIDELAL